MWPTCCIRAAPSPPARVSLARLAELFTPRSREIFLRDVDRLRENRTSKTDSHLNILLDGHITNFLVVMIPLAIPGMALGICHINFDLMHEYDERMEDVIQQLKHAQSINQLILEGQHRLHLSAGSGEQRLHLFPQGYGRTASGIGHLLQRHGPGC